MTRQPALGYMPALDGLRACAVGAVILLHSGLGVAPGGTLGVDVFFVLSGFLITSLLVEEHDATATVDLRAFYLRRVLRLMPALVCLVVATLVLSLSGVLSLPAEFDRGAVLRGSAIAVTYLTDLAIAFTHVTVGPFFHLWSLAIEEHFYLLWPWALLAMLRSGWARRRVIAFLLCAMLAVAVWRAVVFLVWGAGGHALYSFDTQADHLLAGCGLAFGLPWLRRRAGDPVFRGRLRAVAVVAAAGLTALVLVPLSDAALALGGFVLIYLLATCVIAHLVSGAPLGPFQPLSWPLMVYLGKLSYALYLWHFVVFHALTAGTLGVSKSTSIVVRVAVAFALSAASYHLVERYFLSKKPPRPRLVRA